MLLLLEMILCHYFTTILRILLFKNHLRQNISKPYTFWFIVKIGSECFPTSQGKYSISMLSKLMIWHKVCNLLLMINLWKIIEHRIPTHLPLITIMICTIWFWMLNNKYYYIPPMCNVCIITNYLWCEY